MVREVKQLVCGFGHKTGSKLAPVLLGTWNLWLDLTQPRFREQRKLREICRIFQQLFQKAHMFKTHPSGCASLHQGSTQAYGSETSSRRFWTRSSHLLSRTTHQFWCFSDFNLACSEWVFFLKFLDKNLWSTSDTQPSLRQCFRERWLDIPIRSFSSTVSPLQGETDLRSRVKLTYDIRTQRYNQCTCHLLL